MMIFHNISAMNAQRHLFDTDMSLNTSLERLSSGLKINNASDDASGLAIAQKMDAQIAGLTTADQNSQDGQALYKTADGALDQVGKMLSRMEELASRAANATLTSSDRTSISSELNQLLSQIQTISNNTEYNTIKVLSGSLAISLSTSVTTGSNGSVRVQVDSGNSSNLRTGSYTASIIALASAAVVVGGAAAAASMTVAGVITINGVDISVNQSESRLSVIAKINAVNQQTGVVAAFDSTNGTSLIALVSGKIDTDASILATNIDGSTTNTIGTATVGSGAVIRLAGNAAILTDLGGLATGSAFGTNGTINVNGVAASVVSNTQGSVFRTNSNDGAGGLLISTDVKNGANAIRIMNNSSSANSFVRHITASSTDVYQIDVQSANRMRLQVGANNDQAIFDGISAISAATLGQGATSRFGSLQDISVTDTTNANSALRTIQQAIVDVNSARGTIGAMINRLDYSIRTVQIQRENMSAAQARIQDADISLEMTNFTKQQILLQAGTAMLAQANARPQSVLTLLR